MQCYKCGTTEGLSKRGKTVMICRPCRREQYHANKVLKGNPIVKENLRVNIPEKVCKCGSTITLVAYDHLRSQKWRCDKCSSRLTHSLTLPNSLASPEWLAKAEESHKRILRRFANV